MYLLVEWPGYEEPAPMHIVLRELPREKHHARTTLHIVTTVTSFHERNRSLDHDARPYSLTEVWIIMRYDVCKWWLS